VLPTFHEAALALADLLRRTGRTRFAIIRLADMLEQDPYDLEALLLLGRALIDDKRNDAALEAFRRALKFDPEHAGARFYSGVTLARLLLDLPWHMRTAIVLHHVVGMPYDEIAVALERPAATVRSDVHRGLARLRAAYVPQEER